jgi:hypothetical protein
MKQTKQTEEYLNNALGKSKEIPIPAWTGPEGDMLGGIWKIVVMICSVHCPRIWEQGSSPCLFNVLCQYLEGSSHDMFNMLSQNLP